MSELKKNERICPCGNHYHYCGQCGKDKHEPTWKIRWCSENCKSIDEILSNYGAGIMDAETAATLLKSKDLSRIEFWNENYQAAYAEIMKTELPAKSEEPVIPAPAPEEAAEPEHPLSIAEELKQDKTTHKGKQTKKDKN